VTLHEPRSQPCYLGCGQTVYGAGTGVCCAACSALVAARLQAVEQARKVGKA
jgi:hypothetical protein